VVHRLGNVLCALEVDQGRAARDPLGERANLGRVQRRREEERLQPSARPPCARQLGVQLQDRVEVARVKQPVRLVQHEELHRRQPQLALLDQVCDAAGRAAHHVHPALELLQLAAAVDAADEERGAERRLREEAREVPDAPVHLLAQLSRRLEDEGGRAAVAASHRSFSRVCRRRRRVRGRVLCSRASDRSRPGRQRGERRLAEAQLDGAALEADCREERLASEARANLEGLAERPPVL